MKHCNRCNTTKSFDEFHKCSNNPTGYKSSCKTCRNTERRKYYQNNIDKVKTYHKKYYEENKEKHLARCISWMQRNPEKVRQSEKAYRQRHKGRVNAKNRKRELAKINRTPPWANLERIKGIYELAQYLTEAYGRTLHVDHEIPLNGKLVSGLHVEDNLQLLYAEDNLTKSNSWEV